MNQPKFITTKHDIQAPVKGEKSMVRIVKGAIGEVLLDEGSSVLVQFGAVKRVGAQGERYVMPEPVYLAPSIIVEVTINSSLLTKPEESNVTLEETL